MWSEINLAPGVHEETHCDVIVAFIDIFELVWLQHAVLIEGDVASLRHLELAAIALSQKCWFFRYQVQIHPDYITSTERFVRSPLIVSAVRDASAVLIKPVAAFLCANGHLDILVVNCEADTNRALHADKRRGSVGRENCHLIVKVAQFRAHVTHQCFVSDLTSQD